jgi:hypothetical protein
VKCNAQPRMTTGRRRVCSPAKRYGIELTVAGPRHEVDSLGISRIVNAHDLRTVLRCVALHSDLAVGGRCIFLKKKRMSYIGDVSGFGLRTAY